MFCKEERIAREEFDKAIIGRVQKEMTFELERTEDEIRERLR